MLSTPAWRSLNPVARSVYVQLASRYAGVNNGCIPYSVREGADELSVGKSTIQRALNDLVERGFIVAAKRGAFSLKLKYATEWRLTEFGCDVTQQAATKDFARWKPEIQNTVPVVGLTVPVVGPHGTCGGTDVAKIARNSTCGGTVAAPKSNSRYLWWDTYSLPGCSEPASTSPRPTPSPQLIEHERQDEARAPRPQRRASERAAMAGRSVTANRRPRERWR
jgi:hypothetical protein